MSMQPPPPPPPPPPGEPGAWQQPTPGAISVGDAVSYGWNSYWKNVGPLVVIALVVIAINVVVGLIGSATNSVPVQVIIQFIGFFVSMLLSLGWLRVSLEVTRGVKPEVGDLFKFEGYGPYILASLLFALGLYVGLILCIIPGIIFAVAFGFYGFVIVDRGEGIGVIDSLKASADLTRGNRWNLFGLGLVLLLINFVGALACGVGLIFTLGITIITWAYAYRTLSGESVTAWQ
jgi:uncharacterized membrane protein